MVPSFTVVPRFDLRRKGFGPLAVADGNKKGNHHVVMVPFFVYRWS